MNIEDYYADMVPGSIWKYASSSRLEYADSCLRRYKLISIHFDNKRTGAEIVEIGAEDQHLGTTIPYPPDDFIANFMPCYSEDENTIINCKVLMKILSDSGIGKTVIEEKLVKMEI